MQWKQVRLSVSIWSGTWASQCKDKIGHSENKFWNHFWSQKTRSDLQWSPPVFCLNNFSSQTCEETSFATFRKKYCAACRSSIQNFLEKSMAAITTGQTSLLVFQNDVKILFSEWPILNRIEISWFPSNGQSCVQVCSVCLSLVSLLKPVRKMLSLSTIKIK